jgi:hypothetical protein
VVIRTKIFQKASHVIVWLVFSFLLIGCQLSRNERKDVITIYRDSKATEIEIAKDLFKDLPEDDILKHLSIHLKGSGVSVLGEISINKDRVVFTPVIPFTPGLTYEVKLKTDLITSVTIPGAELSIPTEFISFYPSGDTVPENLLKIYLEFSKPMQEGHALENLLVIRNGKDTIHDVFLDLQPELWNEDRTLLTLWLDPGRIKRDLQPNKRMGKPLEERSEYRLVVNKDWQDANGIKLGRSYEKNYVVGPRDGTSPDPASWKIQSPRSDTTSALRIDLREYLDHVLLENAIRILDPSGHMIDGILLVYNHGSSLYFNQVRPWKAGSYTIEIEARLEDLAGNNLNRLFDRDITNKNNSQEKQIYKRTFIVE